jgi:hypothetical protein
MAGHVIGWLGGSCEDELTRLLPVIHRAPYVIPDRRDDLPLVEQPRRLAVENQAGIDLGRFAHLVIDIEPSFAAGNLPSGLGLPAGFGTLDQDRASVCKPLFQL